MKTVTIDDILSWHPCFEYSRERIEELMNGRSSISALEIMDLDIDTADRLWAVLREPFLDNSDLYFLAAAFAERKLRIWERVYPNDLRPRYAIRAARLYAMGEIELDELSAAHVDAWNAACAATYFITRVVAKSAAWTAANTADIAIWITIGNADDIIAADATTIQKIGYEKQIEIIRLFILQKESKIEKVKKTKKTS